MKSSILTIPQELLDQVWRLCREDLPALTLVCKALRVETRDVLYERIVILYKPWIRPNPYPMTKTFEINSPRLRLLLRTILEKPSLGLYVRHLEVKASADLPASSIDSGTNFPSTEELCRLLGQDHMSEHIARIGLSDQWRNAIRDGLPRALVALLVSMCPRLDQIILGLDVVRGNQFLVGFLSRAVRSGSSLHRLKEVSIGPCLPKRGDDLGRTMRFIGPTLDSMMYLWFLCLPMLEEAELYILTPTPPYNREPPKPITWPGAVPQATALRILRLHETSMTPITLRSLLESTPRITTLKYDFCFNYDLELVCRDLMSTLEVVKGTLRNLHLGCQIWAQGTFPEEVDYQYIVGHLSFRDFELNSLRISPCLLFGLSRNAAPALSELLPRRLRTLCFHHDLSHFIVNEWHEISLTAHCTTFLNHEHRSQVAPCLEEIILYGIWCNHWNTAGEFKKLCEQNGLRCDIREG